MKGIYSVATLAFFILITVSCRTSDRDLDTSTGSSISAWTAMNHFHNIMREVHRVAQVDSVLNNIPVADAIVPSICIDSIKRVPDTGPFPIDLSIHYSQINSCSSPLHRDGVINANFSSSYSNLGTVITITLDDYSVKNVFVSGEIKMEVVNSVKDSLAFLVSITNGKIEDTNKPGKNISYFEGTLSYINYAGRKTIPTTDDDFVIEGTGNGIAENGVIYSYKTEDQLILLATCDYERFGSFRLSAPNTQDRICNVNEGDACDNFMLVTIPPANGSQRVEIK